jgi:hypothetical protein
MRADEEIRRHALTLPPSASVYLPCLARCERRIQLDRTIRNPDAVQRVLRGSRRRKEARHLRPHDLAGNKAAFCQTGTD